MVAGKAYVALGGLNVVRVIDLATGQKQVDWPVPALGDIAADAHGTLWAISSPEVVSLSPDGKIDKHFAAGLLAPRYLAVNDTRLAVIDRKWAKIALLDAATGNILRTLGEDRNKDYWMPVNANTFRDPRGAAFLPDGKLLLTEHARVRAFWPETGKEAFSATSNFMETAVTHPYAGLSMSIVD